MLSFSFREGTEVKKMSALAYLESTLNISDDIYTMNQKEFDDYMKKPGAMSNCINGCDMQIARKFCENPELYRKERLSNNLISLNLLDIDEFKFEDIIKIWQVEKNS